MEKGKVAELYGSLITCAPQKSSGGGEVKAVTGFVLAFVFSFSFTAWPQEPFTKVVPRTYSLPIPRMDNGKVDGRTYRNPSLGLEFTPPVGFTFGTPELIGTPGTVPLLVTVATWGQEKSLPIKDGAILSAEALAYYPDGQRSTEAYMRKVVHGNQQEGFEPVGNALEAKLGGIPFSRADFKKWPVHEAVLVKACAAQVFVFIFTGSNRDTVDSVISGTDVKLDGGRSGCDLGAGGRKK
jgi:hypothetical protein